MLIGFTRFSAVLGVLFLLPWMILIGLGFYWLWQQGWLYQGLGVLSANSVLVYAIIRWRQRAAQPILLKPFTSSVNPNWSDKAQGAAQELEVLRAYWKARTEVFSDVNMALSLTNEVLTSIARHFHADSKYPILEFPLPYLLKLMVLVCEDIQHEVLDKIPGSHAVRVGDLFRLKATLHALQNLKAAFNVSNWLFNWSGAALGKARTLLFTQGFTTVTDELAQQLLSAYIDKLGYYAIQLYSGQITLEDMLATERVSAASEKDLKHAAKQQQVSEPLRILLMGQVSTGKSSLINRLFGQIKSAEGLLPTTAEVTAYVLERDGLQQAIVLDSAGYGGLTQQNTTEALKQVWNNVDLILLVCNATQAARQVDAEQLSRLREYLQQHYPEQALPVIIAVLTHVDRLRPIREWTPPYNIQTPTCPKALNIRDACIALASELNLPVEYIVPVCLAPELTSYNIDEGLIPLILERLNAVQRVRYLRCLRQQQQQSYWQQWRKQAINAGQLLLKLGAD